jgi:hypothetical protein
MAAVAVLALRPSSSSSLTGLSEHLLRFEPLPPPTQAEVERLLKGVRYRVLRLLEKRGALPAQGPEDAQQAWQAHSLQQRLRWTEMDARP